METIEIWAPIPYNNHPYQASTFGRVRHMGTERILRVKRNQRGAPTVRIAYRYMGLPHGSFLSLPKLIAETFPDLVPNPRKLPLLGYRDDDEMNCNVTNLYWKDYERSSGSSTGSYSEKQAIKHALMLADQQRWWDSMSYAEQQDMLTKGQPMKGVILKEKDDE
jgi:hypothetical protein